MRCSAYEHVSLTFPAVKVNMGRRIIPSLASGTFAQTAASTAITAPDYGDKKIQNKDKAYCSSSFVEVYDDINRYLTAPNDGCRLLVAVLHV